MARTSLLAVVDHSLEVHHHIEVAVVGNHADCMLVGRTLVVGLVADTLERSWEDIDYMDRTCREI